MGCVASASSVHPLPPRPRGRAARPSCKGLQSLEGIPVPQEYQQQSAHIAETEQRGISVAQLRRLAAFCKAVFSSVKCTDPFSGQIVEWETASKYNVNTFITMPLTTPFQCSTVELVAQGPQSPAWFVSHAWSHSLQETVDILAFHADAREGAERVDICCYWICTFANNQHNLSELGGTLEETPFFKAIMLASCRGTVALVCQNAILFSRIWCLYECHVSTAMTQDFGKPHLYDWGALNTGMNLPPIELVPSVVLQLDQGGGEFKEVALTKTPTCVDLTSELGKPNVTLRPAVALPPGRQHAGAMERVEMIRSRLPRKEVRAINVPLRSSPPFPPYAAVAGMRADVASAQASCAKDRDAILRLIAGTPLSARDTAPPVTHENYDKLNRRIHARFATMTLTSALAFGNIAKIDEVLSAFPESLHRPILPSGFCLPIHTATVYGHVEVVRFLLAAKVDANCGNSFGTTPLGFALAHGHSCIVLELLESRADPHIRDSYLKTTPMELARLRGLDDECASLLLSEALPGVCL